MNLTDVTTLTIYDNSTHTSINWSLPAYVGEISYWMFLGFLILGIPLNVITFFIWLIGPKSKTLCCATYFAANAAADLLCLTIPGINTYLWMASIYVIPSDAYVIMKYIQAFLLASSNWISASITVERALTMFYPFVFRPQAMRKRSKYVVLAICVLLIFTYVTLLYFRMNMHLHWEIKMLIEMAMRIVVPFILIVTINTAVVATLCRKWFQQNTVSTNRRSYVDVFTKITVFTGLSFILSNTADLISAMGFIGIEYRVFWLITEHIYDCMLFFNCVSNPVISFIVCKSVRDDMWSAVCMVARKCRNACRCRRLEPEPAHVQLLSITATTAAAAAAAATTTTTATKTTTTTTTTTTATI